MNFLSPYYLILLCFIPLLHLLQKRLAPQQIRFSALKGSRFPVPSSLKKRNFLKGLNYLILALIVVSAARPRITVGGGKMPFEGIDVVMIIDVSGSMKTLDKLLKLKPGELPDLNYMETQTRLAKVKLVSRRFVKTRKDDRIGLVAFAGKSVLISPLTQDYRLLDAQIASLDFNLTTDGTALGMAIASGITLLKDSGRKEKAIIILTDGINNSGDIEPVQAAYLAKSNNIKIYPIEMGSFAENEILREQTGNWGGEEIRLLDEIAAFTGGRHFTIPDGDALYAVYNEIEKAEKSKIDVAGYADYVEVYTLLTMTALLLLIIQIILLNTRYRKIP